MSRLIAVVPARHNIENSLHRSLPARRRTSPSSVLIVSPTVWRAHRLTGRDVLHATRFHDAYGSLVHDDR